LVNKKPVNTQEIYFVLPRLKEVYPGFTLTSLGQGLDHGDTLEVFNKSRAF
jgi:hypothetical protein